MRYSIIADDYKNPSHRFIGDMALKILRDSREKTTSDVINKHPSFQSWWYRVWDNHKKYMRSKHIRFTNLAEKK